MFSDDYGYIERDSLFACCRDQFGAGTFDGRRKTEFCQEAGCSDPAFPMKDIYGDTKAFTLGDVKWVLDNNTRLLGADVLQFPKSRVKRAHFVGARRRTARTVSTVLSPTPRMKPICPGYHSPTALCKDLLLCVAPMTTPPLCRSIELTMDLSSSSHPPMSSESCDRWRPTFTIWTPPRPLATNSCSSGLATLFVLELVYSFTAVALLIPRYNGSSVGDPWRSWFTSGTLMYFVTNTSKLSMLPSKACLILLFNSTLHIIIQTIFFFSGHLCPSLTWCVGALH